MTTIRLRLLVLKTAGLETLVAYYRAIGLEFTQEQHGTGPIHFSTQVGETLLELYPQTDTSAADVSTRLGFRVANVDQVVQSLARFGNIVVTPPRQTAWGYRAVVRDPDGRAVELYQAE